MRAPDEHPADRRNLAIILAAATKGCGITRCCVCGTLVDVREDLPADSVSDGLCSPCFSMAMAFWEDGE